MVIVKEKILLISMPWHNLDMPSIQLGVLKAFLENNSYNVDAKHLHLYLIKYIDGKLPYSSNILKNVSCEDLYSVLIKSEAVKNDHNHVFNTFINAVNQLVDETLLNISWELYGLIGFTVTTVPQQFLLSLFLANKIKEKGIETSIVFGGYLCSGQLGSEILNMFPCIDFIINGEGEITLKELSDSIIKKKKCYPEIDGLVWRDNSKIVRNKDRLLFPEIDNLPIPDYAEFFTLLAFLEKQNIKIPRKLFIPIESSRGCSWNKCSFCSHNLIWNKYRTKSTKRMLVELNKLSKSYNSNNFYFVDNMCQKDELFWKEIEKDDLNLRFYRVTCNSSIDKNSLYAMRKAGCQRSWRWR